MAAVVGSGQADRPPIVQVHFAHGSPGTLDLEDCVVAEEPVFDTTRSELTLRVDDATVRADYGSGRFTAARIDRILLGYRDVLLAAVRDPGRPISTMKLI